MSRSHPYFRQLTIQDRIREEKQKERSAAKAKKAERAQAKEEAKGQPLGLEESR